MKATQLAYRASLTGAVGTILVALAAGPAAAGHGYGYGVAGHPLRGDFPTATQRAEGAPVPSAAAGEERADARQPGDWLRGDFPRAGETRPVRMTRGTNHVEVK